FVLHSVYADETNSADASETNNVISLWVPGNANPWLAGMPDGSMADNGFDIAPDQSPIEVKNIPIKPDEILTFSVTGGAAHGPFQLVGADGETNVVSRIPGAENGIADITAPLGALIGVFLDEAAPSNFPPPAVLDFSAASNRDFASLYPNLRQPFFIGDGKDSFGGVQQFVVPARATRLFLGTMDAYQWSDNQGSFTVKVIIVPKSP
ncbi:MAG TPA: hypothetical protein VFC85_04360, partial [Verrucomicrobiae bacterium]|nr:hypothetical protein [Verrucomicrobiae bacterium]